jgi:hypothetical protein
VCVVGSGDSAFERLTPEQQIAARAFKLEFELSGIHLPDDKRRRVRTTRIATAQTSQLTDAFSYFICFLGGGDQRGHHGAGLRVLGRRVVGRRPFWLLAPTRRKRNSLAPSQVG